MTFHTRNKYVDVCALLIVCPPVEDAPAQPTWQEKSGHEFKEYAI